MCYKFMVQTLNCLSDNYRILQHSFKTLFLLVEIKSKPKTHINFLELLYKNEVHEAAKEYDLWRYIFENNTGIKWSKLGKAIEFSVTVTDVWDMSLTGMQ